MNNADFHEKPFDEGTLAKLKIFELYVREWLPVFLAKPHPNYPEVHVFDFFSGPGTDSKGNFGSPLRILDQLRQYHKKNLPGWSKVKIVAHLFDYDNRKTDVLSALLEKGNWAIPGVVFDLKAVAFKNALREYSGILENKRIAKLLIIDQFGVDEVSDDVFGNLIRFPTTDFIFFLSSSTLNRFRDHPAIKQKIEKPGDSYHVHRAAVKYFRKLIPSGDKMFLGNFSILKRSNIYGLIFGSAHPLGIHKFLQVAWANDEIAGEANFDIERENVVQGQSLLPIDIVRPKKKREFEEDLESVFRAGRMLSEADVIRFCIEAGMTGQFAAPVIKKLKEEKIIACDFRVPDVRKYREPRRIQMLSKIKP